MCQALEIQQQVVMMGSRLAGDRGKRWLVKCTNYDCASCWEEAWGAMNVLDGGP